MNDELMISDEICHRYQ